MKNCDTCGSTFNAVKKWQKRCSAKCNSIASNARRRADPSLKTCRTCRTRLPVEKFHLAQRSCMECESLRESGLKRCTNCSEVKSREEFHQRSGRPEDREPRCRDCKSAATKERNAKPESRLRKRDRDYQAKYGISLSEVEEMFRLQGGCCAICGIQEGGKPFHVDHDHRTGAVRSLLCFQCNALLGHCREDQDILRSAIAYLERHSNVSKLEP